MYKLFMKVVNWFFHDEEPFDYYETDAAGFICSDEATWEK